MLKFVLINSLQLVAGVYVFKLTVENLLGRESGEALVNVTVHLPARDNTPPIPVISPSPHTTVRMLAAVCILRNPVSPLPFLV